jgi:hypothetical protein
MWAARPPTDTSPFQKAVHISTGRAVDLVGTTASQDRGQPRQALEASRHTILR